MRTSLIVGFAALLIACGGALESPLPSDPGGDPDEGCEGCKPEWSIVDEGSPSASDPVGPDDQGGIDPGEIAAGLLPCGPQAKAVQPATMPEISEHALDPQCPLEQTTDVRGDRDQLITYRWEGTSLIREESVGDTWEITTRFEFDQALEQLVEVEHHDYREFSFADPRERALWWAFDGQGRLIEKSVTVHDGAGLNRRLVQTDRIEQTWEGDRLQRQVTTIDRPNNAPSTTEALWTYDDQGRLIEAFVDRNGDRQTRSEWTWEGDRPTQVRRYFEDELVESQAWQWDEGRLRSRQLTLNGSFEGMWGIGEDLERHDNYSVTGESLMFGQFDAFKSPWFGANAHRDLEPDAECFELPVAVGHGYPHDEDAYHLGWSGTEEEPIPGIGFDYNFNGYSYGYGEHAWYGHQGIGSAWPHGDYRSTTGEFLVLYDAQGRMVKEEMSYRGSDDQVVEVQRARDLDARGLVVRDWIEVTRGDEQAHSTLHLERDGRGQLVKRWRTRGDEPVAHQMWSYDEQGNAISLEIFLEALDPDSESDFVHYTPHPSPDLLLRDVDSEIAGSRRRTRTFDDQGRMTHSAVYSYESEQPSHEQAFSFGPFGPEEKVVTWWPSGQGYRVVSEYDEDGRLITESRYDLDSDHATGIESYSYDQQGRLVEKQVETSSHLRVKRHEFACH